jgi:uncharacterized Zn-binding protein involved in type VI secretion
MGNPAVTGAKAAHNHGVPGTVTATSVPGAVKFDEAYPLHLGDEWAEHYVPEWECSHPTFVTSGANNVICDNRPLAVTELSTVTCGQIIKSPVMTTIIKA